MHTAICDELGIEFPIFAFTHCRDVVVAISKAGGFGVLGAVGFTPEQLEIELNWIDENIERPPLRGRHRHPEQVRGHGLGPLRGGTCRDAAQDGAAGASGLRQEDPRRPRRPGRPRRRGHPAVARLDGGDSHPPGRDGVEAPEGDDDRQRARHSPARHDQPHPRIGSQGGRVVRLTVAGPQARQRGRRHHHRPGRRGRRPLRRGGLNCVVAAGR